MGINLIDFLEKNNHSSKKISTKGKYNLLTTKEKQLPTEEKSLLYYHRYYHYITKAQGDIHPEILNTEIPLEETKIYSQIQKNEGKKDIPKRISKPKGPNNNKNADFKCPREVIKIYYNPSDIMYAPTEKALKIFRKIISGERFLTFKH